MVFKLEIVKNKMDDQFVTELFKLLKERAKINNNSSYTSQLIKNPDLLAKKIGEESSELIIDFIKNNKTGIINESADLLYHLLVIWISMGINPQEIWDELSKRQSQSGIEEKKNSGIYNVGTGKARSFRDLALAVLKFSNKEQKISYVETPKAIRNKYQYFTEANTSKLKNSGFPFKFYSLEKGIKDYVINYLSKDDRYI